MNSFSVRKTSAAGSDESQLELRETGEIGFEILGDEFDYHFDKWTSDSNAKATSKILGENKVCFKQEIASISHPFQTKIEYDWIVVDIPFNGTIRTRGRPRLYRRDVSYVVSANICYPVDLVISHVEKCAKQGAIAAAATALSGSIAATQAAFQLAFLACMAAANFPEANKIDIQVVGDKIHGDWHPV